MKEEVFLKEEVGSRKTKVQLVTLSSPAEWEVSWETEVGSREEFSVAVDSRSGQSQWTVAVDSRSEQSQWTVAVGSRSGQ